MKLNTQQIQTDHDLLVELRVEMSNVRSDIKELNVGTGKRIDALERDKADKMDLDEIQKKVNLDMDKRVQFLENYKGAIIINSGLLWAAWGILLTLMLYKIFE